MSANYTNHESVKSLAKETRIKPIPRGCKIRCSRENVAELGNWKKRASGLGENSVEEALEPVVYIYAYKKRGKIIYVGQTVHMTTRHTGHTNGRLANLNALTGARMVLIRCVKARHANRIEGQVIRSLKRRGQCNMNAVIPSEMPIAESWSHIGGDFLVHVSTGIRFQSYNAAGRFVGMSGATLKNNMRDGYKEVQFCQPELAEHYLKVRHLK